MGQLTEFETSELAKGKGFDVHCDNTYSQNYFTKEWTEEHWKNDKVKDLIESDRVYAYKYVDNLADTYYYEYNNDDDDRICRPTQSVLKTWLRKEHNIHIEMQLSRDENEEYNDWWYYIYPNINGGGRIKYFPGEDVPEGSSYEEVLELALRSGLALIKKLKK